MTLRASRPKPYSPLSTGCAVERVLHVSADEERAVAEPVGGRDAGAGVDLARDRADPLVNGLGPAGVAAVLDVQQPDLLGQFPIAAAEFRRVGQGPPRGRIVVIGHQKRQPKLGGQRGHSRLFLQVERLLLEILRVLGDEPRQSPGNLVLLAGRREPRHVVVKRSQERLHAGLGRGVGWIGQIRAQVVRMAGDDGLDLGQVRLPALAHGHPHPAARFAAHHEVHRAVSVEVSEVEQRAIGHRVQVERRVAGTADAIPARRRQEWPPRSAAVEKEVDVAPVVRHNEVRRAVLVHVGRADVQVIGPAQGAAAGIDDRRGRVQDGRVGGAHVVGDLHVARARTDDGVGQAVAVPVGNVHADVVGHEIAPAAGLEGHGRRQHRFAGRGGVAVPADLAVQFGHDDQVLSAVAIDVNPRDRHPSASELNVVAPGLDANARGEAGGGGRSYVAIQPYRAGRSDQEVELSLAVPVHEAGHGGRLSVVDRPPVGLDRGQVREAGGRPPPGRPDHRHAHGGR